MKHGDVMTAGIIGVAEAQMAVPVVSADVEREAAAAAEEEDQPGRDGAAAAATTTASEPQTGAKQ